MRILKKLVRKLYHLVWFLSLFILFVIPVKAELLYDYEVKLLNRNYNQFPFTTYYDVNETTNYTGSNSVKLYGSNSNLVNPPRYLYLIYCATGPLNFATTSTSSGGLSNLGTTQSSVSCSVNGYDGTYFLNTWEIYNWHNASSSGVYEWDIVWSIQIHNTLSYQVYIRAESIYLSNEMNFDFNSNYILSRIQSQLSSISGGINALGSQSSQINSNIQQFKSEQEKTNDKLDNIDNTLNNDNVDGANSQVDGLLDNSNFKDTTGIQSIINAPLNFINSLSNTCSPINVTIPYIDKPLQIPCIKQELNKHIPLIVPILATAINGFIVYRILLDLVRIIKNARDPDNDRIEVLDL